MLLGNISRALSNKARSCWFYASLLTEDVFLEKFTYMQQCFLADACGNVGRRFEGFANLVSTL
jgi:hypothetical protein